MSNIVGLIFSKDRALQLRATIESFLMHCHDWDTIDLVVLYKTSSELYAGQYDELKKKFSRINFIEESNFKEQILSLLVKYDYILFLVDDNIFVKHFCLYNIISALEIEKDAIGFSLRLGINTDYSYPSDSTQKLPLFTEVGKGILKYCWLDAEREFGYPLEVSSSIFRSPDMLRLLPQLGFDSPNKLEGLMNMNKSLYRSQLYLLTFKESVTFCNPVNVVQKIYKNKYGRVRRYTIEELAGYFSRGMVIDVEKYLGFTPRSAHQEVQLYFKAEDGAIQNVPVAAVEMNKKNYGRKALENEVICKVDNVLGPISPSLRMFQMAQKKHQQKGLFRYGYPDLESSQYWPYERLMAFQNDRLRKLLDYVYANIPGYRRKFDKAGLKPAYIKSTNDLYKLPIVSRRELQNNEDFVNRRLVSGTLYTGGSTGTSLKYYESEIAGLIRTEAHLRGWKWSGFQPDMRYCVIDSAQSISRQGNCIHLIGDLTENSLRENLEIVQFFRPQHLRGYVSSLYIFAKYCLDHNIRLEGIVSAITISENLYDYQRQTMELAFGCKVFEEYCCNDGGACAWECEKRDGLHHVMERAIIEDVDGKMIVTDLWNYAMPFVRYENGDSVTFLNRKCSCGRSLPLIRVKGRTNDIIITQKGVITPTFLMHHGIGLVGADKEKPNFRSGIRTIQYVQKPGNILEVNIVRNSWCTNTDIENLKKDLHGLIGGLIIKLNFVERIATTKKGKRAFVINEDKELLNQYLSGKIHSNAITDVEEKQREKQSSVCLNGRRIEPNKQDNQQELMPGNYGKESIALKPKVSVLIPVYNCERFIGQALESIYNQAYQNFEIIIVDDGSTDRTSEILVDMKDTRTFIYRNPQNKGLTRSLNIGLKLCRGEYIARMDADDVSHPQRFEKQVRFLDENPDCLVVGSWCNWIDSNGEMHGSWEPPTGYEDIKRKLLVNNSLAHGSVMLRRYSLLEIGGYNEKYAYAQDYDLWLRLSEVGQIQNIAEHLYNLRFWTEAASSARKKQQDEYAELALQEALQRKNIQKLRTSQRASSSPQISVVLTAYNRPELLEKTFTGFANQTAEREDFEVIVVDDGSEPPVKEIVKKFSDRINTVYLYRENSGLAAARNNGIKAVKGQIVLFSDDDNIPGPELIAEHLRSHQENPDERIAVLGHLDWHKDLEVTPLMHYVTHVGGEYFGYDKLHDGQFYNVWKWWGGLISAKRSLLTSLEGPFDSNLHWGYEDIELACRLLPKDVKILYNAKAKSFVLVPVDFEGFCRRRYRQGRALYRMACAHPELIIPRYHLQNAIEEYRSRYKPFLDEWTSKVTKFEPLLNNRIQSGRPDIARYLKSLYTVYHECFVGYWLKGYVEEMEAVETAKPLKEPIHAQQNSCSLLFPDTTEDSEPQVDNEVSCRTESDWNQPVVAIAKVPLRMTFVNTCMPGFDAGSSNLRIYHILKILAAAGHKIDHLYFRQSANDKKYKAAFDCTVNFIKVKQTINSFSDYLYLNKVDRLDCVWITNIWSVDYLNFALQLTKWLKQNRPKTKVVIDTMDFHYKKFKRKFDVLHDHQDLQRAKRFLELEKQLYPIADGVMTVTEVERSDILENIGSNCNVSVIPNIHKVLSQSPPLQERKNICFIGSFHIRHNVDAVLWFLREVFPLIIEKKPNVQFHILGFNNEAYKDKFESNRNVKVIGYVKEAEQAVGEYRLFVCPMTYGAGMKGKLGVAATAATPFVTTTIGAEGFDFVDGQHCFISDDPDDFAHKCLRLLDEDSLWSRFSIKAKDMIAEKFSIRSVSRQIYSLLQPIDTMVSQAKETIGSVPASVSSEHAIPLQRDTKPKVSIITSCYNSENFLWECLESIKSQTFQQWELILLDDGSIDGTRRIMEEYSRLDSRVRTYYFDCNKGPYVRRNYAITQAYSDLIVIHDADDIMSPSKLETLYKEIVADERLMVVGSYYRRFIDEFKGLQYTDCHWLLTDHDEILAGLLSWKHRMSHGSAIIRKSVFDEIGFYDENLFASDAFWSAKVGEYAKHDPNIRFKNIPEYLTLIRIHAKGQTQVLSCFDSRNRRIRYRQYWQCKLEKIRQRLRDYPDTDIKTELRNCICSDFLERFEDHFSRWESEPLSEDDVWDLLRNAVWLFNKTYYVTCIDVLNGIEAMVPDIARRFKNYYLLRAIAFFALNLKEQSLKYLTMEIQNHNSLGAREFISDYFENKLTKDVQNWCAERTNLCELLMVDAEGSFVECSAELPEVAKKLCNYVQRHVVIDDK